MKKPLGLKRVLATGALLLAGVAGVLGQSGHLLLHRDAMVPFEKEVIQKGHNFHSAIRPYLINDLKQVANVDSVYSRAGWPLRKFLSKQGGYSSVATLDFNAQPLFSVEPGVQLQPSSDTWFESGFGGVMSMNYRQKLFLNAQYRSFQTTLPSYLDSLVREMSVVPGMGYAYGTDPGFHFKNWSGDLTYAPTRHFDFQLGYGRHFWGEGYRSLLLSDMANNYGYFKMTTKIWKINYVNLFTNFKDVEGTRGQSEDYFNKYGTLHYLSYNATPWLNIGLFEAVIWQGEDTLVNRGYDVNYLNPVIFFRPVEFSTGSADNSLIGLNVSVTAIKNTKIYGQLILDEFLLDEVRSRNGWWANKQGIQFGVKGVNLAGVEGLQGLAEFNYVRPWTYSHGSRFQSYTHFNQPLAHPIGASFWETVGLLTYTKGDWLFEYKFQYAETGEDYAGRKFGGNIFIASHPRTEGEYDYWIGEGVENRLMTNGVRASYRLHVPLNLRLELAYLWRNQQLGPQTTNHHLVSLGLRHALFNRYNDF